MSTHWHNNKNNYNRRSINSWFNLQPSRSTTARVEELGNRDTPIFLHPTPLHQPSWDATIMDTVGAEDAEEAVDHSFSRGAIHPPNVYQCREKYIYCSPHIRRPGTFYIYCFLHTRWLGIFCAYAPGAYKCTIL
jgi:hypothetical protein